MERAHRPAQISPITRAPEPAVTISADSSSVTARLPGSESVTVLLHGATVISWKNADGSENLWLSEAARLDGSKPVRGGIPVVFPVFGAPPKDHATKDLPQHGFARDVRWEYLGKTSSESARGVKLDFLLDSSSLPDKFKKAWPYDFGLTYNVTLSPEGLQTMLSVQNSGASFDFQVLMHTYLRVDDISTTKVTGLAGVTYKDKVLNGAVKQQSTPEVTITGEVDRVYQSIPQNTTSVVAAGKPRFDIVRDNLADTVVWNPWREKAAAMADFEPKSGYKNMLCVEVGAVSGWQQLDSGERWEGGQFMKSLR